MKNNTIFFLTIPLYGHVFPVLDVINKVGKEGYNTYCFVNDFFAEYIKNDNVSVICYPEKVIANFNTKSSNLLEDEHISYYHLNYTSNNIEWSAISSKYLYEYMYDYMMKYVKKYNPQVIIYDSLAKWGGLLAKKFNIHSIAIEVATDIEEANCFYEKFYNEVVLEEIRLDAFNILEYCDGDNSVQDICHLLNTKYDIDEDIIYKDVDKTLQLFWRLKVIKMTGENYLLDRFVYISDKLKIKYLQYEELLDLVSNIDSLKDSLVIAEEGLGLLNNENILKLVWSSGIISGFSMEDNNGNVAKIIIQPNIKYKIFEIIYIEDEDKLPERWTNILISFMKKLYRETLEAKTLVEDGEKVVLIYKAFNKVVLDSSFKAIGILKKEYQQKDVYVYSSEQ